VNTAAAEVLYHLVGDWAQCDAKTLLFDVCCGTGTIGLTLARRVARVVGIDIVEEAITDAKANAHMNGIENAEFVAGKAEETLPGLLEDFCKKLPSSAEDAGAAEYNNVVAIVDPPRAGLHKKVLNALRRNEHLNRLVYVSCNPATLVENALKLCTPIDKIPAFRPVKAVAVDLFPHTAHCEAVMLFERQS
ncbi:hypothetical protein CYMTET_27754, partial [Cymbomonas tetramitiformis]